MNYATNLENLVIKVSIFEINSDFLSALLVFVGSFRRDVLVIGTTVGDY